MELDPTQITTVIPLAAVAFLVLYAIRDQKGVNLAIICVSIVFIFSFAAFFAYIFPTDLCAGEAKLRINEICTNNELCDKNEDYIEIYNAGKDEAILGCYGISNLTGETNRQESHIVRLPENIRLKPGERFAFGTKQFQYGLSKHRLEVIRLYRFSFNRNLEAYSRQIDKIKLTSKCYAYKFPDGGKLIDFSNDHPICDKKIGSFASENQWLVDN